MDDDEAIRVALRSLLRSMGHEVRLFADAFSFLAEATLRPPDCVLTDIQMPGMNGLDLQREIRRTMPGLPVIVITAFPEEAIRRQAMADGALCFLSKPFETAAILHWLAEALGERK
ncbi:response regulator transcription factor [Falsiroseomonas tokyonensis]|uniref:response regulator transcription factor n=1 Tax=Falsiroseomonas tokyonensis TaxID=430521 RepID=UPI001C20A690